MRILELNRVDDTPAEMCKIEFIREALHFRLQSKNNEEKDNFSIS